MSSVEIFTRFDLPSEEVFNLLSTSDTLSRTESIFFKLENIFCNNSKFDLDTSFTQKCVFSDLLKLYCKVQDIKENEKIAIKLEGLIKGMQSFDFIRDDNSCILRESIEFSLYNNFNFLPIEIFLTLLFYTDLFVRHLRLKNLMYKEISPAKPRKSSIIDFSEIRSYIVIDSNIGEISSLISDLNKFPLLLSPFVHMKHIDLKDQIEDKGEFTIDFLIPFISTFKCKIFKNKLNMFEISFSNDFIKGKNIFKLFSLDKKLVIENTINVEEIAMWAKLIWLITGNTFVRSELNAWNKRLKEVVEKTTFSRYVKETFSTG